MSGSAPTFVPCRKIVHIFQRAHAKKAPPSRMGHLLLFVALADQQGGGRLDGQSLVVVFEPEVGDQVGAHDMAECILQLHRLDEEVVLRRYRPSRVCGDLR